MELNQITANSLMCLVSKSKVIQKTVELITEHSPVCDSITPTVGGGTGAGESWKVLERS